jgi:ankyrin repeat protein
MLIIQWLTGLLILIINLPATSGVTRDTDKFHINRPAGNYLAETADSNLRLLMAADRGDLDSVIYYIDRGVDINFTSDEGVSPLMYAASNGHLEIVRFLVENGAEIDLIPLNGYTALASACLENHYEVALFLLQQGADTEITDNAGVTPLLYTTAYDNFEITELLLMFGADPMYSDLEGATALHAAALYARLDIAWLLLDFGSDIDANDNYGFTPLMMAIQLGREDMVDYLLENNASVHTRSRDGMSPLAIAIAANQHTIAEKLIGLGANPRQGISWDKNMMNLAKQTDNEKIISLLESHNVRANILPAFNTLRLSGNVLVNTTDFFNGLQAGLEDEKYNLLLTAGWYTRPVRRSVLVKLDERWFDQVWEQRHLFYGGLHKVFPLKYTLSINEEGFFAGINVGYSKGTHWGTYRYPEPGWHFVPSVGYFKAGSWWFYNAGYEYLQFNIPEKSPHRIRLAAGIRFRIKRDPVVYRTTYW